MKSYFVLLYVLICCSCDEVLVPKPKAFLSLDYTKASYHESLVELPFEFEKNRLAQLSVSKKKQHIEKRYYSLPNPKSICFY